MNSPPLNNVLSTLYFNDYTLVQNAILRRSINTDREKEAVQRRLDELSRRLTVTAEREQQKQILNYLINKYQH